MSVEFDYASITVDEDGEFTVWAERYDTDAERPDGEMVVGEIEAHLPLELDEMAEWLADKCPNFRYPDTLTDEEKEEIRELIRESGFYE